MNRMIELNFNPYLIHLIYGMRTKKYKIEVDGWGLEIRQ